MKLLACKRSTELLVFSHSFFCASFLFLVRRCVHLRWKLISISPLQMDNQIKFRYMRFNKCCFSTIWKRDSRVCLSLWILFFPTSFYHHKLRSLSFSSLFCLHLMHMLFVILMPLNIIAFTSTDYHTYTMILWWPIHFVPVCFYYFMHNLRLSKPFSGWKYVRDSFRCVVKFCCLNKKWKNRSLRSCFGIDFKWKNAHGYLLWRRQKKQRFAPKKSCD